MWKVELHPAVVDWFDKQPAKTQLAFDQCLYLLQQLGPNLGRPLVDVIKGSELKNLKELRPPSAGTTKIRALFIFDAERKAIVLVVGDKSGHWQRWYKENIPLAESRFKEYLNGNKD